MYNENSNVLSISGLSAGQLEDAVSKVRGSSGFTDFQAFVDLENKYGINSLFALAHAAVESAWGTSEIATSKNNLFGFDAYDSAPQDAASYPSQAASIDFYGSFLKSYYLTPGGKYYNGPTIHDVFIDYSTSDTPANEAAGTAEDETISGIMNNLHNHISVGGTPVPAPVAVPTPSPANTYEIKSGDTFWALEQTHGWTHGVLEQLNPGVNPTDLQVGEAIHIPGNGSAPVTEPNSGSYTIASGDTFWALEQTHSWAHGTLEQLNPGVNPTDLQIGEVIKVPGGSTSAPASTTRYIIKQGDTFWSLETANGWSHGTLIGLNPGVNPTDLQIGEAVNIP
jgi:LysM repeat protein